MPTGLPLPQLPTSTLTTLAPSPHPPPRRRQVTILNSDNGVFFSYVDRSTMRDVVVDVTQPRWAPSAYSAAVNGGRPGLLVVVVTSTTEHLRWMHRRLSGFM